jgi:hypothetical protein
MAFAPLTLLQQQQYQQQWPQHVSAALQQPV